MLQEHRCVVDINSIYLYSGKTSKKKYSSSSLLKAEVIKRRGKLFRTSRINVNIWNGMWYSGNDRQSSASNASQVT